MAELQEIDWSRSIAVDCIDDRGFGDGQNIKVGGAGAYGLAKDLHVARALQYPGTYAEDIRPLGETAKIISVNMGRYALLASIHEECAAEQNAAAIGRIIIDHPNEVLSRAKSIMLGDISSIEYEQVADVYERILSPNLGIFRGEEREAACMDTPGEHPAILRKTLLHELHSAAHLQVSHVPNTWFDTADAYANGEAAYHKDQWAVPFIAETIDDILPHDNINGFVIASSIRTAATSLALPYAGDLTKTGVDIKVLASN